MPQPARTARHRPGCSSSSVAEGGGNHHQQGEGTYHVIACRGSLVHVSTLGRFATSYDADHSARQALEAAGFRWIDDETGAIKVTDLCVYYFGGRVPLTVDTLLFSWQD
ncbi:hypothetical protein [Actinacidiphila glaucinigra]|uniref:hypothetical protein n=1 Tax=Actinacidiphila glaucinigra TaxID=235986 RepID=UPI00382F6F10